METKKMSVGTLVEIGLFFCVSYAFLPIIRVTPTFVRAIWRLIPEACLLLVVLMTKKTVIRNSFFIVTAFSIFIAIMRSLVYANGIVESYLTNIANSILYWHYIVYFFCIVIYLKEAKARKLFNFSIKLIILTCFTTSIGNLIFPEMSRYSSSFLVNDFAYYKYNVGAYAFIYAIVFVLAILLALIADKKKTTIKEHRLYLVCAGLIVACIILSQYMTALSLILIAVVIMVLFRNQPIIVKAIIIAIVLLAFLFIQPILQILLRLMETLGFESLAERVGGISNALFQEGSYGDVMARMHLYRISLQYFWKNPFFGLVGYNGFKRVEPLTATRMLNMLIPNVLGVGQHSDLIDLLGGNGLVGVSAFVFMMLYFYKKQRRFTQKHNDFLSFMRVNLLIYIIYGIFDHSFSCIDVAIALFALPAVAYKGFLTSNEEPSAEIRKPEY